MDNEFVQFNHVGKRFHGHTALTNLSFKLPQGKIIGVIGPNGAGESTMLKLMAGLLRPTSGEVLVGGKRSERRSSAHTAYFPEQGGSYPFYTVAQTIEYYNTVFSDFHYGKALEMIEFMQLDLKQRVGLLSKGNRTRLKLVTALSRNAPLILLDEPLSGLDPMIRESIIQGLIALVHLPEQTVILTTHEVAEVEPILDMIIAIKDGQIIKIDEVENIRSQHGSSLVHWMKEIFRTEWIVNE